MLTVTLSPSSVSDESMTDFTVEATVALDIPEGDWTIAIGSDDGGLIQLDGINFGATYNEEATGRALTANDNEIYFGATRSHGWTAGQFTVPAGGLSTTVRSLMFERSGDDSFELAIRSGLHDNGVDNTDWVLLEDEALGWSFAKPAADLSTTDIVLVASTAMDLQNAEAVELRDVNLAGNTLTLNALAPVTTTVRDVTGGGGIDGNALGSLVITGNVSPGASIGTTAIAGDLVLDGTGDGVGYTWELGPGLLPDPGNTTDLITVEGDLSIKDLTITLAEFDGGTAVLDDNTKLTLITFTGDLGSSDIAPLVWDFVDDDITSDSDLNYLLSAVNDGSGPLWDDVNSRGGDDDGDLDDELALLLIEFGTEAGNVLDEIDFAALPLGWTGSPVVGRDAVDGTTDRLYVTGIIVPDTLSAVPEPGSLLLLVLGAFGLLPLLRRRSRG
jgi:hypothetical protein